MTSMEEDPQQAVPMDEDSGDETVAETENLKQQVEEAEAPVEKSEQQLALDQLPEIRKEYDDSHPPIPGLKYCVEQDGYRYYIHPITHQCFTLTFDGQWYFQLPSQEFVPITDDIRDEMIKVKRHSRYIKFDDEGHPVYPRDAAGFPILPLDEKGGKIFPFDELSFPVFPWDPVKKTWTMPVDDTHQAVFPFNHEGFPLVPVDENDKPIFPVDADGAFIFPLGNDGMPMPAMTAGYNGKWVVPTDSRGEPVVPFDTQGNPLIHITADGTPVTQAQFLEWQRMNTSAFEASGANGQSEAYHGEGADAEEVVDYKASIKNFMRSKRVRPEDIDLPDEKAETPSSYSPAPQAGAAAQQYPSSSFMHFAQMYQMAHGQQEEAPMQIDTENAAAEKRKKMLTMKLKSQLKIQKAAAGEDGMSPKEEEVKLKPVPVAKTEKPKLFKPKTEISNESAKRARQLHTISTVEDALLTVARLASIPDVLIARKSAPPNADGTWIVTVIGVVAHVPVIGRRSIAGAIVQETTAMREDAAVRDRHCEKPLCVAVVLAHERSVAGTVHPGRARIAAASVTDRSLPIAKSGSAIDRREPEKKRNRSKSMESRPVKKVVEVKAKTDRRSRTPREENKKEASSPVCTRRSHSQASSSSSSSCDSSSFSSSDSDSDLSSSSDEESSAPASRKSALDTTVTSKWDSPGRNGSESPGGEDTERKAEKNGSRYDE
ncbi:hypothetical protein QR680_012597 [Steinernema hermaphroditum]|uniref:Uncharacterized protein n=1 Tax=Steinernema hermaphroditum TaxID=289476 RepID=A0AA39M0S7_9BILA|nr:hypothetical protein QR680_012597 [Steinernema hermaphroditum]